jgi:hypothetical protein
VGVVVVADHKKFRASLGEVQHVLGQANAPAAVLGGIAHDTKGADLLSGEWGGNLDRTMLIKTAREVARQLVQGLPPIGNPAEPGPAAMPAHAQPQPLHGQPQPAHAQPQPAVGPHPGWSSGAGPQPVAVRYSGPQPGRHQADPGQVPNGQLPNGQAINGEAQPAAQAGGYAATQASAQPQPRMARHTHGRNRQETESRQETGNRHGSFFSRPPMTPLTTPGAQAPAEARSSEAPSSETGPSEPGPPEQEDAEDTGRGATPWDRQGPAGSMGSRRSGGG